MHLDAQHSMEQLTVGLTDSLSIADIVESPLGMISSRGANNPNPFNLPTNMLVNREVYLLDPDSYDKVALRGEIIKQIISSYFMATSDIAQIEKLFNLTEIRFLEPG